jgi:hypothetical protein
MRRTPTHTHTHSFTHTHTHTNTHTHTHRQCYARGCYVVRWDGPSKVPKASRRWPICDYFRHPAHSYTLLHNFAHFYALYTLYKLSLFTSISHFDGLSHSNFVSTFKYFTFVLERAIRCELRNTVKHRKVTRRDTYSCSYIKSGNIDS